jgi:hypothetical protein
LLLECYVSTVTGAKTSITPLKAYRVYCSRTSVYVFPWPLSECCSSFGIIKYVSIYSYKENERKFWKWRTMLHGLHASNTRNTGWSECDISRIKDQVTMTEDMYVSDLDKMVHRYAQRHHTIIWFLGILVWRQLAGMHHLLVACCCDGERRRLPASWQTCSKVFFSSIYTRTVRCSWLWRKNMTV